MPPRTPEQEAAVIRMSDQNDDKREQSQKFIDKARELGTDEDEKAFEGRLRRIAKQQPKKEAPDK